MATSQQFLVCDNSTVANYKQWAQAISTSFASFGWLQSADTGQVNWSTIAAVPSSGAYFYEIWQPNDGLTNFYLKVEYGNANGANAPGLRLTLSTSTNGAGVCSGFIVGPLQSASNNTGGQSTTAQYECDFSGAAGRFGALMWRNAPTVNSAPSQVFVVERSVDSTGAYTSTYVTLWVAGSSNVGVSGRQQSLVFGVGPATLTSQGTGNAGWIARLPNLNNTSAAFNGTTPFDTCSPLIGYFDYPCTAVGIASGADISDGVTFVATVYGATRTYVPTKTPNFANLVGIGGNQSAVCLRYD